MQITTLSENAKICFAKALVANELGNQMSLVYKFSDADGERTGKSGWSFGVVQFDINNNANAIRALEEMEFTPTEIMQLRQQQYTDVEFMTKMNAKLLAHRDIIDRWDRKQISECLSWPLGICNGLHIDFSGEEAFIHIADYRNQFGISIGGKMYTWLGAQAGAITPEMIRDFKYTTKYGIAQKLKPRDKDDVWRRYHNIVRIMRTTEEV